MKSTLRRHAAWLGSLAAIAIAAPSNAAVIRADITLTAYSSDFSDVIFTFQNLSTAGYQISNVHLSNAVIDWVGGIGLSYSPMSFPAGGSATAINGTQVIDSGNPNDGCAGPDFNTSGFDTGETFSFYGDPEPDGCPNDVYDFRQRLVTGTNVFGFVSFTGPLIAGSTELSGNNWVKELINPAGADVALNQRYRLSLLRNIDEPTASVPEPLSLAMLGAGLAGMAAMRRRRKLP